VSALRPSPTTPGTLLCPRCGNTLRDDQSWCLECGFAARTRVHPPPSWRIPLIAICLALALLAAGIAIGLVALLDKHEPVPPAATVTVPATAPPAATTPTITTPTTPAPTVPTTPTTPTTSVPTTSTPSPGGATAPGGIG
jgi:hypothetical protein